MRIKNFRRTALYASFFLLLLASSCTTPVDVAYMQDMGNGDITSIPSAKPVTLQPGDRVLIVVKSKDPELSYLFNLSTVSYRVGDRQSTLSSSQQVQSYLIDNEGNIDFPVLGTLHVGGLNREQIAAMVKEKLVSSNLVKDPVVTADYDGLCYSVLGEVNHPGQFTIDRDKVTLYDAIAKAGDLTIYGNRKNIKVQRTEGDSVRIYAVDLTSGRSPVSSPAFYIKQNDVVYITPNETRQRQSTVNGNNTRSTSFWLSVSSVAATIAAVVISIVK